MNDTRSASVFDSHSLLAALTELSGTRADILHAIPAVLAKQGEGHVVIATPEEGRFRIFASNNRALPENTVVRADGVISACARLGHAVYVPDTSRDDRYRRIEGASAGVELALPIFERDSVIAVLNIERDAPFTESERDGLRFFVNGVSQRLTDRSRAMQAELSAELGARFSRTSTLEAGAEAVLDVIMPVLGASSGALVREKHGCMALLAARGERITPAFLDAVADGVPYPRGVSWQAALTGGPQFVRNYDGAVEAYVRFRSAGFGDVLAFPVGRHGVYRNVLTLELPGGSVVSDADLAMMRGFCEHLALLLEDLVAYVVQERLLELQTRVVESDTDGLYQTILEAAVELVPGAEAGMLVVRSECDEAFHIRAAEGVDLEGLSSVPLQEREMRSWYGDDDGWHSGRVRVSDGERNDLPERMVPAGGADDSTRVEPAARIRASAALPVLYRGRVLALLSLESFTRANAFKRDSVWLLRQFTGVVVSLLRMTHDRDLLHAKSVTDDLTGLPNRRGYEGELERIRARASRSREPFAMLVMDLNGFKRVNDTLGHERGDEALRLAAEALAGASRDGDVVARWGGDEFTALLPGLDAEGAQSVMERFEAAIDGIEVGGLGMGIAIGASSYPADGVDADSLLRAADRRMYEDKSRAGDRAARPLGVPKPDFGSAPSRARSSEHAGTEASRLEP